MRLMPDCVVGSKWLPNAFQNQNTNQTVVKEVLRLEETSCDAYTNYFESHDAVVLNMQWSISHDVTVAILLLQNKETAAMLVYQTKPLEIELHFHANFSFCGMKLTWPLVT